MDAIKMQDTKAMTIPFPSYKTLLVARNGQADETSYQGL